MKKSLQCCCGFPGCKKCVEWSQQIKPLAKQITSKNKPAISSSTGPDKFFRALLILALTGLSLISLSVFTYVIDPQGLAIKIVLTMSDGSFLFRIWKKPPVPLMLKVYIFNVTNPNEFLRGEEKLRLHEVGPYVYREILEHENITFGGDGTVKYTPVRYAVPSDQLMEETAEGRGLDDQLIVPNIPLLAIASKLSDYSFLAQMGFATLVHAVDSQPFENVTVKELLWGHPDPFIRMANLAMSKWITFKELGLLDRLFDITDEIKMELNKFTITEYNGRDVLWPGYNETDSQGRVTTRCRETFEGASEGILFPSNAPEDGVRVYRKPFCRTLALEKVGPEPLESSNNIPGGIRYRIPNDAFNASRSPEHSCHCGKKSPNGPCKLVDGLSDITDCWFGIPVAASFPHFLNGDPSLLKQVEGMHPDSKLHEPHIVIQEKLGIPVAGHVRMQINLVVKKTRFIKKIKKFDDLIIPLLWVHWTFSEVPPNLQWLLDLCLKVVPPLQYGFIYGSGTLGISLLLAALLGYLCYVSDPLYDQSPLTSSSRNSSAYQIVLSPNDLIRKDKDYSSLI